MTRVKSLKAKDIIKVLEGLGFQLMRQRGSHAFYKHPISKRTTVVPIHSGEDIGRGLLRTIMKQIDVTPSEFIDALHKKKSK